MASSKDSPKDPKGKTSFHHLPLETQKGIFRHVSTVDLLSLQRVSQHFFSLATAEIYRDLNFNFTSSDAVHNGTPHSRTADAIQTVVASDRDYGQHIRSFRLGISEETSNNALLMSRVLWDSAADPSKVLNTLILLMARKAQMMESFQWDTPIELNGRVYQALHKIPTLRHLRIRLDVPASMKTTVHQTFPPTPQITNTHTPSSQLASAYSMASTLSAPNTLPGAKSRKMQKKKTSTYDYWANGRAFSGFKHLCSLTLLGLSNLDCLGEICDCLKASSTSLRSLTLSLSAELARKARQPSVSNPHPDDATDTDPDGDDEDEMNDPQMPNQTTSGQPVNEADIRKEKLAQEAILAKIFDLQGVAAEGKRLEKTVTRPIPSQSGLFNSKLTTSFASDFKKVLKMLLDATSGDLDLNSGGREVFEIMQKAATDFLEAHPKKGKKAADGVDKPGNFASGDKFSHKSTKQFMPGFLFGKPAEKVEALNSGGPSSEWLPSPINDGWASSSNEAAGDSLLGTAGKPSFGAAGPYISPLESAYPIPLPPSNSSVHQSIFGNQGSLTPTWGSSKNTYNPEGNPKVDYDGNIDWELVKSLNQGLGESQLSKIQNLDNYKGPYDFSSEDEAEPVKRPSAATNAQIFPAAEDNAQEQEDSMDIDMEHPDENTIEAGPDQEILPEPEEKETVPRKRARFAAGESSSQPVKEQAGIEEDTSAETGDCDNPSDVKSPDDEMREYIRATHGLQLEELSLYLIPLKASILARALDLQLLRRLTLLSVGSQEPFWLLLTKLQRHSAHISFDSIHTDHVSSAFLEFLKTFEGLQELFMLERNSKNEADSGVSKAIVNITSIRKLALATHIRTLERLMIKNENDDSWDVDTKMIRFLSVRGAGLTELAISLNMKHYHILIQQLPGFKNLVALQFFSLRVVDRSAVLQIESLTFAADSISHLPQQKIKYLALESHVTCIERKSDFVRQCLEMERGKKTKGKGKGKAKMRESPTTYCSSDSDLAVDEFAEITSMETRLRFGIDFWEIKGIKIFQKEIRTGKL